MITRTFPMWPRKGRMISLQEVLLLLDDNDWQWNILDLDGTGVLPHDMSWDEFDKNIEAAPYALNWAELTEFANRLVQVIDGEIVAISNQEELARIQAFDSSEWTISIVPSAAQEIDNRISRLLYS